MAVQPQTPYQEDIANGVTTVFPLKFDCESKDHLIVLIDDVETDSLTWSLANKQVTFTIPPESNKKITFQRNTPFKRERNYQSYDNSLRPTPLNQDFDWIWFKLQELGVADWLLKIYVDRLHQQQEQKIDGLKNYVDLKDDELRAYLMEEIRKQGVALDQLDEYYNYLMERLAQIAVDKGWDSSFVVHKGQSQYEINEDFFRRKGETASVRDFGAKGDDNQTVYDVVPYMTGRDKGFTINKQTADGISFNKAIDWLKARGGGSLYIPPCESGKSYRIYGYLKHIDFPCVIYGAGAASLIKNCDNSPTNVNGYGIFVVQPKFGEDVSIMNLKLDGNAEVRSKPTSELQLYPLIVYGMPRFRMYGVTSENSPIDCFTTTFDTGFDAEGMSCFATIVNCLFNNSYRNTVTVSKGHNIKFVNCVIQRGGFIHGGTNPRYCVDIEPNIASTVVNSKWVNCTFSHGRNVLVGGVWSDSMFSNCTFDASYVHADNIDRKHFPWVFQFTAGQWDIDNCKFIGRKDFMRNQCYHYSAYGTGYNFTDDVYLRIKNSTFVHCGLISAGRSISIENCLAQLSMCPFLFQGGTASPTHDVFIKNLRLVNVFDGSNVGAGASASLTIANSIKGVVDVDGVICEVDERSLGKIPVSLFEDIGYFGVWLPSQLGSYGRRARIQNIYCEGYYNRIHNYAGFTKNTTKRRDWGAPNAAPMDTDAVVSSVAAILTDGTVASNAVTNKAVTGTATQNNPISSRTLGGRSTLTWKDCTMWGDYN